MIVVIRCLMYPIKNIFFVSLKNSIVLLTNKKKMEILIRIREIILLYQRRDICFMSCGKPFGLK